MRLSVPLLIAAALLAAPATGSAGEKITTEFVKSFPAVQARQAVAVDGEHFYAINNHRIVKYEKATGKEVLTFEGGTEGPFTHLDSGVVIDGKLYAAHSNYPDWPMASSVEIFDAATLQPIATHSFGIERGSLTWLDRDPKGNWWGAFANYNRVFDKSPLAYGNKFATQIVRFGRTGGSPRPGCCPTRWSKSSAT